MTERKLTDEQAEELLRLRYTLRRAAETRRLGPPAERALTRMEELSRDGGPSHLFFEHRRWQIQLSHLPLHS